MKVENEIVLTPSCRALLFDLDWIKCQSEDIRHYCLCGSNKRQKDLEKSLSFTTRGPQGFPGKVIILSKSNPIKMECKEPIDFLYHWNNSYNLISLEFTHQGKDLHFEIYLQ